MAKGKSETKTESKAIKVRGVDPATLHKLAEDAVKVYAAERELTEGQARDALIISGWNRLTALANHYNGSSDKKRGAPGRKSKVAAK